MNATKIEYLNFTWSPLVGCSGLGCAVFAKCWAKYQAKRQKHKCLKCYDFLPHVHKERMMQPYRLKTPKIIGACFSADMWDKGFTQMDREIAFSGATVAEWHWFVNITKQPQNILQWFQFPDNWVQGVSVNVKSDLYRINELRNLEFCQLKMISFEPLYEDLGKLDLSNIDWVIIGNQTHPLKEASWFWIENIVAQAKKLNIPVFIKNNIKNYMALKEYPKQLVPVL